tara:strand:- start:2369 stop:3553 length:1185 start_codon:yes stop_codon:yes gene_type:complete
MNIQPDYDQIEILLDKLINFKINDYDKLRNYVYYEKNRFKNISGLSAFISRGFLREKTLLKRVIRSGNKNEKFIQEIFWRVYWQGWLESYVNIWEKYKKDISLIENNKLNKIPNYQDAINGNTSIQPFDEWVKILKNDGYLHNHERMWFSSIWIHYLEIPWQLGCKFFYENLLDADVASNLLSWRWVAGLQTYGKKYIATESNINKYTYNRYLGFKLPKVKDIVIKNEDKIINSITASKLEKKYQNCAFLIMENDLNLDLFNKLKCKIDFFIIIKFNLGFVQKSENVVKFQKNLFKEFIKKEIDKKIKYFVFELPNENSAIYSFIKKNNIANLLYNYTRVGYEKDILDKLLFKLKDDILIHNILDDFYYESWQFCKKGFFKFKEKIPILLSKLN